MITTERNQTQTQQDETAPMIQKSKEEIPKISYLSLFTDTTKVERFLMILGVFCALAAGTGLPLFALVFGSMTTSLAPKPGEKLNLLGQAGTISSEMCYIALGIFVTLSISMTIYLTICEKISCLIRKDYFKAMIRQEIGWFDVLNPNELAGKVALDNQTIQKGIGESIPTFFMASSTVISGFILAFARGWELSLVLLGVLPFMSIAGGMFAFVLRRMKTLLDTAYISASGMAEQSINAIKTVKALGGEEFEYNKFFVELKKGVVVVKRFGMFAGFSLGFLFFCFQGVHALAFWFGGWLIDHERENAVEGRLYNIGDIMTIFICITMGSMVLAQIPPPVRSFVEAKDAGSSVFYVIKRKPKILINDASKQKCKISQGNILVKDLEFAYPVRLETKVLKKVNIEILANKKTAFVGESGSGKSTIIALLERFYDPLAGGIYLDGVDLRDFNLQSLRKNIGYVGQEPVLFSGTIRDNLLYGKEDATEEEMWDALRRAEAYNFVMEKEKKLDTFIGVGGGQLSGGQKQRVAIARAILKNPPILLLDEATSALDRENEMLIQKTLDSISGGRTTIVVAHRLTTIQDADRIYVMSNGEVDDYGTHEELLSRHGKYEALVKLQLTQKDEEEKKMEKEKNILVKHESFLMKKSQHENEMEKSQKKEKKDEKTLMKEKMKEEVEILKKDKKEFQRRSHKVFQRLFTEYQMRYWFLCICSYGLSMLGGGIQPLMAILMGYVLESLGQLSYSIVSGNQSVRDQSVSDVSFYSGMFVVLGVGALLTRSVSAFIFTLLSEKLSLELKSKTYDITLKREIAYFDKPENNPGIISSRISYETQNINRLVGSFFAVIFSSVGAFITGIVLSFIYSWQLALLSIGISPFLVMAQYLRTRIHTGFAISDEAYNEAGAIIMETAVNMRTVASFCNEEKFVQKFNEKIDGPMKIAKKKGFQSGIIFGFSQCLMYAYFACIFYVASVLQEQEGLDIKSFIIAVFSIIQAAGATSQGANFMPDVGEAIVSAEKIFDILDAADFENYLKHGKIESVDFKGHISIKNIYFKYPNSDKFLFEDFSLEIPAGKKIAFVGPSGCGKSTLFQLILKFYPVFKGQILIDGVNIDSMDVRQLRSLFGVVSQEPTLFLGTIAYNIKYNTNATMEEIRNAAENANALKFIENNEYEHFDNNNSPLIKAKKKNKESESSGVGFDKQVGSKGSQISGGQKQRIAIARAIIKNPRILLLDEATSALDAQNEAIVQDSLNKLMIGKTSLIIAHRISTIKDSDEILVFGEGKIVERGVYADLVAKKGVFYKFERGFGNK